MTTKMKLLTAALSAGMLLAQGQSKVYTGIVTDTMCGANHAPMRIAPDEKCVRDCVKSGNGRWKYALLDGSKMYVLSDQQTPEKFAAKKVAVTGVLDAKTGVLKVAKMAAAK